WYKEALSLGWNKKDIMASIYAKGRDNSRTPMQWDQNLNAGFTEGMPWLDVNPNYKKINAEKDIKNPNGVYNFTKELFKIRKQYDVFTDGDFKCLDEKSDQTFIYKRTNQTHEALVITNLTHNKQKITLKETDGFK